MSEINTAISPAGYTSINQDKSIDTTDKIVNRLKEEPVQEENITEQQAITEKETTAQEAEVETTVEQMNNVFDSMNRNISFSIDEDLGNSIIVVKDSESDEVIRQMPSEELMVLRKKMDDVAGILFDTKV